MTAALGCPVPNLVRHCAFLLPLASHPSGQRRIPIGSVRNRVDLVNNPRQNVMPHQSYLVTWDPRSVSRPCVSRRDTDAGHAASHVPIFMRPAVTEASHASGAASRGRLGGRASETTQRDARRGEKVVASLRQASMPAIFQGIV